MLSSIGNPITTMLRLPASLSWMRPDVCSGWSAAWTIWRTTSSDSTMRFCCAVIFMSCRLVVRPFWKRFDVSTRTALSVVWSRSRCLIHAFKV